MYVPVYICVNACTCLGVYVSKYPALKVKRLAGGCLHRQAVVAGGVGVAVRIPLTVLVQVGQDVRAALTLAPHLGSIL
jgi:hypothetical protein